MAAAPVIPNGQRPKAGIVVAVKPATVGRSMGRWQRNATSPEIREELYEQIPVFKEAIGILAGFVGVPEAVGEDDEHTADLNAFLGGVRVGWSGWSGRGAACWLRDHIGQALWHGYAVGECEISPGRDDVAALWSYRSEHFSLEPQDDGSLSVFQTNAPGGKRLLNPLTVLGSTFEPQGQDPRGQALFRCCIPPSLTYVEAQQAFKQTNRRQGVPVYHLNWEPPPEFVDREVEAAVYNDDVLVTPAVMLSDRIVAAAEAAFNGAIKSQVELGIAKDFITTGKWTIQQVHRESVTVDFQLAKRNLLEEPIVASGVPPSIYGYAWSSTERMSSVQLERVVGKVWVIRYSVEPALRAILDLRGRLRGDVRPYSLTWPDTVQSDQRDTAAAALDDAKAKETERKYWFGLWRAGIADQARVAEELTGSPGVAVEMDAPPAEPTGGGFGQGGDGEGGQ